MANNKNEEIRSGVISACRDMAEAENSIDRLRSIWEGAIGVSPLGINDDFFRLGGHSLIAAKIVSDVRLQFNIAIPVSAVYSYPTLAAFTAALPKYPPLTVIRNAEAALRIEHGKDQRPVTTCFKVPEIRPCASVPANDRMALAVSEEIPASHSQKRLWLLESMLQGQPVYNVSEAVLLKGKLNLRALKRALAKTLSRQDIMRTGIREGNGEIVQFVVRNTEAALTVKECSSEKAMAEIEADAQLPFILEQPPLFRLKLFRTGIDSHIFYFNFHHAITDGISTAVFMESLAGWYNYYSKKKPLPSPATVPQYLEYSNLELKLLQDGLLKKQEDYWCTRLAGDLPRTKILPDFADFQKADSKGSRVRLRLTSDLSYRITQFCAEQHITVFVFFHACIKLLVSRYTGSSDIVLNIITSGRTDARFDGTMGCFVNTLPMRDAIIKNRSFEKFLKDIAITSGAALDNQDYPFDLIVRNLTFPQADGQTPLSEVALAFQNHADPFRNGLFLGLRPSRLTLNTNTSMFDLLFIVEPTNNKYFSISCEYKTSRVKRETVVNLLNYCIQIIQGGIRNPSVPIQEIPITMHHARTVKVGKVQSDVKHKIAECPHIIFEHIAKKKPDSIAIETACGTISYRELNEKANQLARYLQHEGIKRGQVVAVSAERDMAFFIGILAVLKAGCAYLPIEPSCPPSRLLSILKNSHSAAILLGHGRFNNKLGAFKCLSLESDAWCDRETSNLNCIIKPRDRMYVIYTSGSTGEPKGVMISHTSAMAILRNLFEEYPLHENGAYLFKTSASFDVSIPEIFMGLVHGRHTVVLENGQELEPEGIYNTVNKYKVSHVNFVPSAFGAFIDFLSTIPVAEMPTLKYVFLAGEALSPNLVRKWLKLGLSGIRLHNLYGPTEFTVYATRYPLSNWDGQSRIPIGKPFNGIKTLILDELGHEVPPGIPGELCLTGAGIALGYLGRKEESLKRFVRCKLYPGQRMYKTGDISRWTTQGEIDFLGRYDTQVKIRGYRIELDEIASSLLAHPDIENVACIVKENKLQDKHICAYYQSSYSIQAERLAAFLSKKLPAYMIPAFFFHTRALPLTSSNKIDRSRLASLECGNALASHHRLATGAVEERLTSIWCKMLGCKSVGPDVSFFQAGGHSLKLVQLAIEVQKAFGLKVPLAKLYEAHTISLQTAFIERETAAADVSAGVGRICEDLKREFGGGFMLKILKVPGGLLNILFTDHSDQPGIFEYIAGRNAASLPHYILSKASLLNESRDLDLKQVDAVFCGGRESLDQF